MFKYVLFIICLPVVIIFPSIIDASEIRILFSSSLNGNLDGCSCKTTPVSGLVKRGFFIEKYRIKHPGVILVDSGDLIADAKNSRLATAVYRAYRMLRYNAVLPGDQDISMGVSAFKRASRDLPLVASNLFVKSGLIFKTRKAPFHRKLYLKRANKRIAVIGISHNNTFRFSPVYIKKSLSITSPAKAISRISNYDLLIILSHGGVDADKKMAKKITLPAIIIGGHDQTLFKPLPGRRLKKNLWYFQSGRDGNSIGEIVLKTLSGGRYQIKSQRLITFDYDHSPDHIEIRRMIKKLKR